MEAEIGGHSISWPLFGVDLERRLINQYDSEQEICLTLECVYLEDEDEPLFDAKTGVRVRMECTPWTGITKVVKDVKASNFSEVVRMSQAVRVPTN